MLTRIACQTFVGRMFFNFIAVFGNSSAQFIKWKVNNKPAKSIYFCSNTFLTYTYVYWPTCDPLNFAYRSPTNGSFKLAIE